MKKIAYLLLTLFALSFTLQGCIFVVGAAAGAAAIAIVYDHRTIELSLYDAKLSNRIANRIHNVPGLKNESHVEVTVFNNIVLLTGQTPNAYLRQQAESIARNAALSSRIYNQITIEGPTSTLTRTSDSWITTKIRGEMLAEEFLKSSSIKVVTENGVVYLLGSVTRDQADRAVDIAKHVAGVQKVVKVFQYR